MKKSKYLIKADYANCTGYWVRLPVPGKAWYEEGGNVAKWFSRSEYGTMAKARKAAIAFRDAYLKKHGLPSAYHRSKQVINPMKRQRTNTSGVIGVGFSYNEKSNGTYYYWSCHWSHNSKQYRKSFSIEKWGYDQAFLMACEYRHARSGVLVILDKSALPCLPQVPYIEV